MPVQLNRRTFLKAGTLLSAGAFFSNEFFRNMPSYFSGDIFESDNPELFVAEGDDYYSNTMRAIAMMGGMKNFVKKDSVVGLLINSRYNKPGTFVKPDIALAAINMCFAAGAREIISLENVSDSYWNLSSLAKKHSDVIKRIRKAGSNFSRVKIPKGISLKEAEVEKDFLRCDVFINIAIFKQHEGIRITGCLKNLMGLTSYRTNDYFHNGSNSGGGYSDVVFLSQCIADINLVRKADLCIADATEFITSNGPFGPGKVVKAKKVIAGTDIVAIDAFGAKILGYNPEDILPIKMASKHGLGQMDLKKIKIRESRV